jgi:hypothetical protein
MTRKKLVADEDLGVVALRQHELFRRVKEGSLDVDAVIRGLQRMIETGDERQPTLTPIRWEFCEETFQAWVTEHANFSQRIFDLKIGGPWGVGYSKGFEKFAVPGDPQREPYQAEFRLVRVHVDDDLSINDVKEYADSLGHDLATPWELMAAIQQTSLASLCTTNESIMAYGDVVCRITNTEQSYCFVYWGHCDGRRCGCFYHSGSAGTPEQLMQEKHYSSKYILLRRRDV